MCSLENICKSYLSHSKLKKKKKERKINTHTQNKNTHTHTITQKFYELLAFQPNQNINLLFPLPIQYSTYIFYIKTYNTWTHNYGHIGLLYPFRFLKFIFFCLHYHHLPTIVLSPIFLFSHG